MSQTEFRTKTDIIFPLKEFVRKNRYSALVTAFLNHIYENPYYLTNIKGVLFGRGGLVPHSNMPLVEGEHHDEVPILKVSDAHEFINLLQEVALLIEKLSEADVLWAQGQELINLWHSATPEDFNSPVPFLHGLKYGLDHQLFMLNSKQFQHFGEIDVNGRTLSVELGLESRTNQFESPYDLLILVHPHATLTDPDDQEMYKMPSIRYWATSVSTATVFAVQTPDVYGITKGGTEQYKKKLWKPHTPSASKNNQSPGLLYFIRDMQEKGVDVIPGFRRLTQQDENEDPFALVEEAYECLFRYLNDKNLTYIQYLEHLSLEDEKFRKLYSADGVIESKRIIDMIKFRSKLYERRMEWYKTFNRIVDRSDLVHLLPSGEKVKFNPPRAMLTSLLIGLYALKSKGIVEVKFPVFLPTREHVVDRLTEKVDYELRSIDLGIQNQLLELLNAVDQISPWKITREDDSFTVLSYDASTAKLSELPSFVSQLESVHLQQV